MPGGKHKAISVRPLRIAGIVPQVALPKHIGYRRQCHGRAGMAAIGFLHGIHGQRADSVYA